VVIARESTPEGGYPLFDSKDELVAEYLRCLAAKASASWDVLAAQHPGDPRRQLRGWLEAQLSAAYH